MKRQNFRKAQIKVGAYKNCKVCHGEGRLMYDTDMGQRTRPCDCGFKMAIVKNLSLTWGFMASNKIQSVKETPLIELDKKKNLAIITATQKVFAQHLKCCMITHAFEQNDPCWWVDVTNDKDIIEAWLYTARLQGDEIYDADIASSIFHADNPRSIKELALSSDLMVVQLGKKVSPNKETHSVLLEALDYRIDNDLTTWLTISPQNSLEDIQAYSDPLRNHLEDYGFEDIVLETYEDDDIGEIDELVVTEPLVHTPKPQKPSSTMRRRAQSIIQPPGGGRPLLSMSQGRGKTTEQTADIEAMVDNREARQNRKKYKR